MLREVRGSEREQFDSLMTSPQRFGYSSIIEGFIVSCCGSLFFWNFWIFCGFFCGGLFYVVVFLCGRFLCGSFVCGGFSCGSGVIALWWICLRPLHLVFESQLCFVLWRVQKQWSIIKVYNLAVDFLLCGWVFVVVFLVFWRYCCSAAAEHLYLQLNTCFLWLTYYLQHVIFVVAGRVTSAISLSPLLWHCRSVVLWASKRESDRAIFFSWFIFVGEF